MPADRLLRNDRSARFGASTPEPHASAPAALPPRVPPPDETPACRPAEAAKATPTEHDERAASGLARTNL